MPSNTRPESTNRPDCPLPNAGPINYMHDVFSEPHRRLVLYRLDASAEPVPLSTLVDDIRSADESVPSASLIERWLLYEHVLPLERFGLVRYDPEAETVELSEEVVVTVAKPQPADLEPNANVAERT